MFGPKHVFNIWRQFSCVIYQACWFRSLYLCDFQFFIEMFVTHRPAFSTPKSTSTKQNSVPMLDRTGNMKSICNLFFSSYLCISLCKSFWIIHYVNIYKIDLTFNHYYIPLCFTCVIYVKKSFHFKS